MTKRVAHIFEDKWRSKDVLLEEEADFASLLLTERVLKGLHRAGFKKPSPIQLEAIPVGRYGKDLIVQAKSGTGKTLVFAVVALEMLVDLKCPQVLILAPAREVATQICDVVKSIGSAFKNLRCCSFIGGLPVEIDVKRIPYCQIVVGTPGRVKQLIDMKVFRTTSVRLFVFDEVDQLLLSSSFRNDIDSIFMAMPKDMQVIATSATYPKKLKKVLKNYLRDPYVACLTGKELALLGTIHYITVVKTSPMAALAYKIKLRAMEKILTVIKFSQCLVFCNLISRVDALCHDIAKWGFTATYISSAKEQSDRLKAIEHLKQFKCKVLVSSDLTARGIDAENVDLIINFDLPCSMETYLHRVGRAGRYGSRGIAVTFLTESETIAFRTIQYQSKFKTFGLPDPVPVDLIEKPDFSIKSPVEEESSSSSDEDFVDNERVKGTLKKHESKPYESDSNGIKIKCNDIQKYITHKATLGSSHENIQHFSSDLMNINELNKSQDEHNHFSENGYSEGKLLHEKNEMDQLNITSNSNLVNNLENCQSDLSHGFASNQLETLTIESELFSTNVSKSFMKSSAIKDIPENVSENTEYACKSDDPGKESNFSLTNDKQVLNLDRGTFEPADLIEKPDFSLKSPVDEESSFSETNQESTPNVICNDNISGTACKPVNEVVNKLAAIAETFCIKAEDHSSQVNCIDFIPVANNCLVETHEDENVKFIAKNNLGTNCEHLLTGTEFNEEKSLAFPSVQNDENMKSDVSESSPDLATQPELKLSDERSTISENAVSSISDTNDDGTHANAEDITKLFHESPSKVTENDFILDFVQEYETKRNLNSASDLNSGCPCFDPAFESNITTSNNEHATIPSDSNKRSQFVVSSADIKNFRSKNESYYYNALKSYSKENKNKDVSVQRDESKCEIYSEKCDSISDTFHENVNVVSFPNVEESCKSASDNFVVSILPSPNVNEVSLDSSSSLSEKSVKITEKSILSTEPKHESTPLKETYSKNSSQNSKHSVTRDISCINNSSEDSNDVSSSDDNTESSKSMRSKSQVAKVLNGPERSSLNDSFKNVHIQNSQIRHQITKDFDVTTSSENDSSESSENDYSLTTGSENDYSVMSESIKSSSDVPQRKFSQRNQARKPWSKHLKKKEEPLYSYKVNKPVQTHSNIKHNSCCRNKNSIICPPNQSLLNERKQGRNVKHTQGMFEEKQNAAVSSCCSNRACCHSSTSSNSTRRNFCNYKKLHCFNKPCKPSTHNCYMPSQHLCHPQVNCSHACSCMSLCAKWHKTFLNQLSCIENSIRRYPTF